MRAARPATLALLAALLGALLGASLTPAEAARAPARAVPAPSVAPAPDGLRGHALWDSWYDLRSFGYVESEHLVSGTALDPEGNEAPYTTRIIVTRPEDPRRFNGTAVLDWANVTAQFEIPVDTMEARELLMREGYLYVHVSAQAAGVCCTPLTPKVWDPVRYAALSHPGDAFAPDMFSQVARAVRDPRPGNDPTGGADVRRVVAVGQSQSCSRLFAYLDGPQGAAGVIDAFLLHGCRAAAKRFERPLTAKAIHLLSDAEAHPARPTGDPSYRLWEVAGTAHTDQYVGWQAVAGHGPRVLADAPPASRARYEEVLRTGGAYGEQVSPLSSACVVAGSTMPMRYAVSSAIAQLDRWVRAASGDGDFVPRTDVPRFAFDGAERRVDVDGNTVGGIRLPPVDVPVARYETTACPLGGVTVAFTDAELRRRYPTHARYLAMVRARAEAAVRGGWMLRADAVDLLRRACAARVRWGEPALPCGATGST